MLPTDQLPGRTLTVEGHEYLYFSGTSYLGIARNELFAALVAEGMKRYGTNYSSSRLSNVQLRIFEEAEEYLAGFAGAEAALTMSSGYLAGQMVMQALRANSHFIYAPGTHPAVWLEGAEITGGQYAAWTVHLLKQIEAGWQENVVIVCNSLDPLLAQKHDFSWIHQLPARSPITLLMDDSHGLGITGWDGAGIFSELVVPAHIRLIVVSSLGKALGIPGGVVLADKVFIEQLRASPFFGASSPVIPAYLHAFLQSEDIYKQARQRLFANTQRFSAQVSASGLFQTFPHYPVFYTPANELYPYLKENGVLISSFPYPLVQDECVTRVVLSSLHTPQDVDQLSGLIVSFSSSIDF
ncbi:MAG: aminotransferase class I/II-fold pyridoxal phosphate-dependent enzyme [Bacteroidota bacterium]